MFWSVIIPLETIICLPERGSGMGGVSFVRLSPLIFCHFRREHSCGELPIWKGLVCHNPSEHHYLPPDRRSCRGWSVLYRVYFVQLYPIFCCRRCRAHSCGEMPFRKGWVDLNPSGHHHMCPGGRSGRGLSCFSTTLLYFLSSSSLHSYLPELFFPIMFPY